MRPPPLLLPPLLLLLLRASHAVVAPTPKWAPLTTGKTHSSGTSATVSPDGSVLYVTSDDGALIGVNAETGSKIWEHVPTQGGTVWSASGVAFSPDGTELAYSVTFDDAGSRTSRIYGFDHTGVSSSSTPSWISDPVTGTVSGDPAFGTDGEYLYFTHNGEHEPGTGPEGSLTVLDLTGGGTPTVAFAQRAGVITDPDTIDEVPASALWSPVGVARGPNPQGNYRRGQGNTNDLAMWANLAVEDATEYNGYTWAYQFPMDPTVTPVNTTTIHPLTDTQWSTWTPPRFTSDGQGLFFSGNRCWIRGWTSVEFQRSANIKANPNRDGPNPVRSALSMSPDELTVYSPTTSQQFVAIDVTDPSGASTKWTTPESPALDSIVRAGSKATPDGTSVLFFTGLGRYHALNSADGAEVHPPVPDTGTDPPGEVAAEFSLTRGGGSLYYVTTDGTVSGWTIGEEFVPPETTTAAPGGGNATDAATTVPPDGTDPTAGGTTDPTAGGTTDAPPDGTTDAPPEGTTDAPPDGTTDTPPDGTTDAPPDGTTDAPPDGTTDGTTDAPPDEPTAPDAPTEPTAATAPTPTATTTTTTTTKSPPTPAAPKAPTSSGADVAQPTTAPEDGGEGEINPLGSGSPPPRAVGAAGGAAAVVAAAALAAADAVLWI